MRLTEYINQVGEHPLILDGEAGSLEAILSIPLKPLTQYFALIGHPHSLQGGTMNNKVVTTLARVFKELGIPSLRFNFRGVGVSEGVYDAGIGESEDMIALAQLWHKIYPQAQFILAGFSFGSYVAYRAAHAFDKAKLITIAPPVHHYDYTALTPSPSSWLIIQGDEDEVVPADLVYAFAKNHIPEIPVIQFPDTGHFFHGKLLVLKDALMQHVQSFIPSPNSLGEGI
jgi:uncharacterized protein